MNSFPKTAFFNYRICQPRTVKVTAGNGCSSAFAAIGDQSHEGLQCAGQPT